MNEQNPYAAPASSLPERPVEARQAPLFGYGGVVIATLLGSVLGGGLLVAMNFHAMSRGRWTVATVAITLLVFVGSMAVSDFLPVGYTRAAILWGVWMATALVVMRVFQGSALASRRAAGIGRRPWWLAFGLGLLIPLALIAISMAVLLLRMSVRLPA